MSRTQKILTTVLWGLMVLVMVSVIGAGWWKRDHPHYTATGHVELQPAVKPGEALFPVPAFSLTDQNDQPVTDQTLRGKPWIAAFIFTNCAGPCPMMSASMAMLQERVPHPDLKLVSFTVDPRRDTSEVLKRYAQNVKADETRWSFLTGTEPQMAEVARGMLMAFQPATEQSDIIHSTKFLLVDKDGGVRGAYSSDAEGMNELATEAAKLVGLPEGAAPTTQPNAN